MKFCELLAGEFRTENHKHEAKVHKGDTVSFSYLPIINHVLD